MGPLKTAGIVLTPEMHAKVKGFAKAHKVPMTALFRRALLLTWNDPRLLEHSTDEGVEEWYMSGDFTDELKLQRKRQREQKEINEILSRLKK